MRGTSLLLASLLLISGASNQTNGATVRTDSGLIDGHAAPHHPRVLEFLGVPYAQAPVGELRFAAPVRFTSSDRIDAIKYAPDCPANTGTTPTDFPGFTTQAPRIYRSFTQQLGTNQSEDCLFLNIWTKESTDKPKPVLFWIHGGRFTIGGSNSPFYNGEHLANDQDVVVVTINYRLNIFGFPGAPSLTQNLALLDQRLAVEWVRDNIGAFGGDPNRITLFGQSAGGASVDYYSYAWTEDPIVNGLISHSGTALSFYPNTANESAAYFFTASAAAGCGGAEDDEEEVISCMRGKDVKTILAAVAKVPFATTAALPQPVFHPTVDNKTVFTNYTALSSAGKFTKQPYFINSNDYESGFYKISAYALNKTLSEEKWANLNLAGFTCASEAAASDRAAHGVSVWRSRYIGEFPNLRLFPSSGAYHGADLNMVFGTAEDISQLPSTPPELALAKYMSKAWVAFASDPHMGLSRLGWPKYNSSTKTLIRLGYNNETTASFVDPATTDAGCAILGGDSSPAKGAF